MVGKVPCPVPVQTTQCHPALLMCNHTIHDTLVKKSDCAVSCCDADSGAVLVMQLE